MKITWFVALALVCTTSLFAQQDYFVFIQQPQGQPFYVRMQEESYSSSASGHLILGTMRDSVYNMYVGFPRGRYGEQMFVVKVDKRDRGFELLQSGGRWHLVDLQSKQQISSAIKAQDTALVRRNDTYSELMANVVDDSSVLYKQKDSTADKAIAIVDSTAGVLPAGTGPVQADTVSTRPRKKKGKGQAKANNPKPAADSILAQGTNVVSDSVKTAVINQEDTSSANAERKQADSARNERQRKQVDTTNVKSTAQPTNSTNAERRDPRDVVRYGSENVDQGLLIIYLDRTGPVTDTIRIIVPR